MANKIIEGLLDEVTQGCKADKLLIGQDAKRTASEIRAYCEAASEGPWFISKSETRDGVSVLSLDGKRPTLSEIEANREFVANARADLPRVLTAAATEHGVLETLVNIARGISKSAATGHPLVRWEIMQLDDALMAAGKVLAETVWLAEEDTDGGT